MTPGGGHVPVLLDRVVELLGPALAAPGAVLVDATVGLGGHAKALLERHPGTRLIGIDRDPEALAVAVGSLGSSDDDVPSCRIQLRQAGFEELPEVLAACGLDRVDAVLFDLGVSSLQLDRVARGFSYAHDAPLDMRMDPSSGATAADVLNTYPVRDLSRVLAEFGEERFAGRIAAEVARARRRQPLATTGELVELIYRVVPAPARRRGGHPAKRTFQALRVEVNHELDALRRALPAALAALRVDGRVAVLAYQSLEDRIVKQVFTAAARPTAPRDLPAPEGWLELLGRGAARPTPEEVAANPRAASARLRAARKLREAA